jgi:hypothetical protein
VEKASEIEGAAGTGLQPVQQQQREERAGGLIRSQQVPRQASSPGLQPEQQRDVRGGGRADSQQVPRQVSSPGLQPEQQQQRDVRAGGACGPWRTRAAASAGRAGPAAEVGGGGGASGASGASGAACAKGREAGVGAAGRKQRAARRREAASRGRRAAARPQVESGAPPRGRK